MDKPKCVTDLYLENYKILMREIKKTLSKLRAILYSSIIATVSIIPSLS